MQLVIDAFELCYAREHINTFVIASGDSDFCPLAYKLRENDRVVIGLAVREANSPFFVKACDEFIYLRGQKEDRKDEREEDHKEVRKDEQADRAKPEPARVATSRGRPGRSITVTKSREVPATAREVARACCHGKRRHAQAPAAGPPVVHRPRRRLPRFQGRPGRRSRR